MSDRQRQIVELNRECEALHALLAHACDALVFYADRGNYNAADDGIEARALDELAYITSGGEVPVLREAA
jgi:hypothetical protein